MKTFEIAVNGNAEEQRFESHDDEAANRHAALIRKGSPTAKIVVYEIGSKKHERFLFEGHTKTPMPTAAPAKSTK